MQQNKKVFQLVDADGLVVNSIVVDVASGSFTPPPMHSLVETSLVGIGDKIINGEMFKRKEDEQGNVTFEKIV